MSNLFQISLKRPSLPVAVVAVMMAFPSLCSASIDLGLASPYAVFGLGSTMDIGNFDTLLNNTAQIYGSLAVGADTGSLNADGNGTFQKGFITGNLYVDGPTTPASYTIVNKDFTVNGTVFGTVPGDPGSSSDSSGTGTYDLVSAVQDAVNRSAFYDALANTGTISGNNINLNGGNTTVNAGVYDITSLYMNSGAILTINGAATDSLVLNISGAFTFAKSFIQLTGGITSANVLFNVTGYDATSGGTAEISGDNSVFFGTLLAVGRNIDIQGIGSHNGSVQGVSFGTNGDDGNPGLEGRVIGALGHDVNDPLLLKVYSGAEVNFSGFTPPPGAEAPEAASIIVWALLIGSIGFVTACPWRRWTAAA
jgi:hypothetical protein